MKASEAWPLDIIQRMQKLNDGRSASAIGVMIGKTRNAVISKCDRLGIRLRGAFKTDHGGNVTRERLRQSARNVARNAAKQRKQVQAKAQAPKPEVLDLPPESTWSPLPGTTPVSFADNTGCKWPINAAKPFMFCGCKKHAGTPYCPTHAAKAFRPLNPKPISSYRLPAMGSAAIKSADEFLEEMA